MYPTTPLRPVTAVILIFVFTTLCTPASALELRLGTGEEGSFSHFSGRVLCRIVNRQAVDLSCTVVPAPGDTHNLTNLRSGSLDLALVDSKTLHAAVTKSGRFRFLDIDYDTLRMLLVLYDVPVSLVVRSDAGIASLAKLPGKRINIGAPESRERSAADIVLAAKDWTRADFSVVQELSASQSQDTMAFCHGSVQAMVHIGVHPDTSLQQLFKLCSAELVSMDDADIQKLIKTHPAIFETTIAAGTYPLLPQAVKTFGTRAILVASDSLDEQTVYQILEAITSHADRLRQAHPALSDIVAETMRSEEIGVPLHPGAARFLSAPDN